MPGTGYCTGALLMPYLIMMTMSASVGEIFNTLVWHPASNAEGQLLAYQIIYNSVLLCVSLGLSVTLGNHQLHYLFPSMLCSINDIWKTELGSQLKHNSHRA